MDCKKKAVEKDLLEKCDFPIENIQYLAEYDTDISRRVLAVLLEWACYGQNIAGIMEGRNLIKNIPAHWLKENLPIVVRSQFEYADEWNYRRLLELIVDILPEIKGDILALNSGTDNPDILEVINDFS